MARPAKITVNRTLFMAWVDGIILDFKKGKGIVTDHLEKEFKAAEKAMDDGQTIYLTNDAGKIVTQMRVEGKGDKAGYVESEVK
jgi:hypothetical protein